MTVEIVRDISKEVFITLLMVSGPILLVSLVVGLLVSFFQAVTQLQEFTLTFVPKIIAVFTAIFILMPFLARIMIAFTTKIIENLPQFIK
ncbi:MAG: flagellar biosynthesis protein FliQ [Candidatus Magnetoovum sp. WYHC-5]|nr:flagellar biosynthesis protein FliQ [Candidatus Magnetoovum sp. WYHC-5]